MKRFNAARNKAKRQYACLECCHVQLKNKMKRCTGCGEKLVCFQSKSELERYTFLRGLEVQGIIQALEYQYRCPLHAVDLRGEKKHVGYYIADFVFRLNNRQIIEDLKGKGLAPDALSSWKIKHFEAEYGQKIEIVHNPKYFYELTNF